MTGMIALTLFLTFTPARAEDLRTDQELRDYCTEMWNARGARERREYVARDLDRQIMEELYALPYREFEESSRRAADALEESLLARHARLRNSFSARELEDIPELSIRISRELGRSLQQSPERGGIGLGARWYSLGHPLIRQEAVNASEFYAVSNDFCLKRDGSREEESGLGCGEIGDDPFSQLTGPGPFRNVLEPVVRISVDESTGAVTLSYVITACLTHYEGIRGWVTPRAYAASIGEYLERTMLLACVQTTISTGDGQMIARSRSGDTITEAIQLGVHEALRRNFAELNGSINQGPYRWDDILGFDPPSSYCDWMEELDRRMAIVSTWTQPDPGMEATGFNP